MMSRMLERTVAALLALLLLMLPVLSCAEEEEDAVLGSDDYTEDDAWDEEDVSTVETAEAGDYEWYMLPADVEEGHAYVDIYPSETTVTASKDMVPFTFVLEETNGYDFTITSVTLIGFVEDEEVYRESVSLDDVALWCPDLMVQGLAISYYTDSVAREGMDAVAVSIIGTDSTGEELEFHAMFFIED